MIKITANGMSRTFRDLADTDFTGIDSASAFPYRNTNADSDWDHLLTARRVLIISEQGVGKTYECRACQQRLWDKGEPAFFLELATLADTDVINMFSVQERERLDNWLHAQSDTASFFLDSIDELKTTQRSFEQALKRLSSAIAGHLHRARIIITTRPIPIDRQLIERHLPIPAADEATATAERFADVAMRHERNEKTDTTPALWRNVQLTPLTREQIREFAVTRGVRDPDALLCDIEQRQAEEYARRPQDLIELCADWNDHRRIRKHAEQVATSVVHKLKARTDRPEMASLADARALEGASRLALAALLTRKLTLRHNAESDSIKSTVPALDASEVLTDWSQLERDTLLERALFGFANYGRVRFHHRSVVEYLAAQHLEDLLQRGMSIRAARRILFAETAQGNPVVRPSLRTVAAWLSLKRREIFAEVLRREPEVLLIHGDPQSLTSAQRSEILKAYVRRYGKGGWRGLKTPVVQVYRFACVDLEATVRQVWDTRIENPEVREWILELIDAGKLTACADIAYAAVMSQKASQGERLHALEALIGLENRGLSEVSSSIETSPDLWPAPLARSATLRLFPMHLDVQRLCAIVKRVPDLDRAGGELRWRLPQLIDAGSLAPAALEDLRDSLTALIVEGAQWHDSQWPHIQTRRVDVVSALMATCNRQFREGVRTPALFRSSVLAIRLAVDDGPDVPKKALHANLAEATAAERERAFWADNAFVETLHKATNPWQRVFLLSQHGGIRLNVERDRAWVIQALADPANSILERAMMLWAAMILVSPSGADYIEVHENLKLYVADAPALLAIIDQRLKPSPDSEEVRQLAEDSQRHRQAKESQDAAAHASWVNFWREISDHPEEVFEAPRAESTAWNLWHAMERAGTESRSAGWNRRFIEQQFGRDVADRLRATLKRIWRTHKPTLRSERPVESKNTFLVIWQLGLAGIYAEAEDPEWATKLTDEEAQLASHFAPVELHGFPPWLDALVASHALAVDTTLGTELGLLLRESGVDNEATVFLQNVLHASLRVAALFTLRIKAWLDEVSDRQLNANDPLLERIRQAVGVLMHSGGSAIQMDLQGIATKRLAVGRLALANMQLWLPVLMHLNAEAGVTMLERGLHSLRPSDRGTALTWFASLFDWDSRGTSVDLRRPEFSPKLLLRLVKLAYRHVQPADDARHEGGYAPSDRDRAERGRNEVLRALLATTGADGWAAKLDMAADPLFAHMKDRVIAIARERAAEEVDGAPLTEADVVELERYRELPPATRDAMFALLRDRLGDIDDLLLRDASPRELWATVTDERIMRRALTRELESRRNGLYTIDQEGVTADEKRTDIRLRATRSDQEAVIELKIGEKRRPALALRRTLQDQLVKKYMAPDACRAGCLLITIRSNKTWTHPQTRQKLDFAGLIDYLSAEAERLSVQLGGSVRLMVKGLDLRRRLTTERKANTSKKVKSNGKSRPQRARRVTAAGRGASAQASSGSQRSRNAKARRRV